MLGSWFKLSRWTGAVWGCVDNSDLLAHHRLSPANPKFVPASFPLPAINDAKYTIPAPSDPSAVFTSVWVRLQWGDDLYVPYCRLFAAARSYLTTRLEICKTSLKWDRQKRTMNSLLRNGFVIVYIFFIYSEKNKFNFSYAIFVIYCLLETRERTSSCCNWW